ncbi:MAG TPA: pitrilysin family protein [Mucilaginibacter sp.]
MKNIRKTIGLCVMSAAFAFNVNAQSTAPKKATSAIAEPVKITTVEGITEYRLGNGLVVLLFPDQTKQTATVNITYLVGSKFENYGETGMAHLLEHMVFKGTPKHPDIPNELTSHGARPNGTTWLDRTNYFETFSATDENMNWALDLESDRMVNSYIAKAALDKEFTVVRNEMESGENDPQRILSERMMSTAYLWHNYGKSTIGNRADVELVPIDRLQAFYHKFYQPDNAVLTVSGKFDPVKVLPIINQKFGSIPKPTRVLPPIYTVEPTQDGERSVTLRRVGDIQLVSTMYHVPSGSHADFQPIEVLQGLLSDVPAGRLYKKLVESKMASEVNGFDYETKDPGVATFTVTVPKEKNLDAAKDTLINTVETFSAVKPTTQDVDRIKTEYLKDIDLRLNSSERVGLALSEYIAQGDWRLLFYQRDQLKKVTPEDVARVADKYFKQSNRTLGLFIPTAKPDRAEIPPAPNLEAMLKGYTGSQTIAQGEAFDATPGNIQSRLSSGKVGGLTVNFLSKKNRGEAVNAVVTLMFGNEASLQGKGMTPSFTAEMLNKGTSGKTRQEILDAFDKLKARVNFSGGASSVTVTIETTHENLPDVVKLVTEILKDPIFPDAELDKLKASRITALEAQRSEPSSVAITEFQRYIDPYGKDDPRYSRSIDESEAAINSLKSSDLKSFYKDFYGASNGYITVVGDFDSTKVKSIIATEFSGWKSPRPFARLVEQSKTYPATTKSIETPDKANAFFIAFEEVKMSMKDSDYPAMIMANYIIGGGFLNSRLATRIRQKEGISYGVGSQFSAGYFNKNSGGFIGYAIYAPENVKKLDTAFKEEIEKVAKNGFTEQELAEAKKGYLQSRQVTLAQDASLANTLNTYSYYGEKIAFWQKMDDAISKLTLQDVNKAVGTYLKYNEISIFKAGDFNKKPVPAAPAPAGK